MGGITKGEDTKESNYNDMVSNYTIQGVIEGSYYQLRMLIGLAKMKRTAKRTSLSILSYASRDWLILIPTNQIIAFLIFYFFYKIQK